MARAARAHVAVVRRPRALVPARVADGGFENALALRGRVVLEEDVLDAPEASSRERRDLGRAARRHRAELRLVGGCVGVREDGEKRGGEVLEPVEHKRAGDDGERMSSASARALWAAALRGLARMSKAGGAWHDSSRDRAPPCSLATHRRYHGHGFGLA
jgi:hypothetical protein